MKKENFSSKLSAVEKTLFLPLWARARDAQSKNPILGDTFAKDLASRIWHDLPFLETKQMETHKIIWAVRSLNFDNVIKRFIEQNHDPLVVNLGAGLDTALQRIDNGKVHWINLELPEVAALRHKLIPDSEREITLGNSIFDFSWMENVSLRSAGRSIIFFAAGVFCYFKASEVESLFRRMADVFPESHFIFDAFSRFSVWATNRTIMSKKGMNSPARLKWHLRRASDLKKWISTIRLIEEFSMLSAIEPGEDWDRKVIRDLKLAKTLRMDRLYRLVHIQFS